MKQSDQQNQSWIDLVEGVQTKLYDELKIRDEKNSKFMNDF